jgi:hypothetical protein
MSPRNDNPEGVTVTLNHLLARTAGEGRVGRRCDGRVVTPPAAGNLALTMALG